jgi:hypothetical protein
LLANDEGNEAPHEHDDVPPQPQPQPQGPPLDPLMPQSMNVIQQGMQAGIASFHSSYNEQYHQLVMQRFDSLHANLGAVQSDVDSLSNQLGHLSTSVQHIQ